MLGIPVHADKTDIDAAYERRLSNLCVPDDVSLKRYYYEKKEELGKAKLECYDWLEKAPQEQLHKKVRVQSQARDYRTHSFIFYPWFFGPCTFLDGYCSTCCGSSGGCACCRDCTGSGSCCYDICGSSCGGAWPAIVTDGIIWIGCIIGGIYMYRGSKERKRIDAEEEQRERAEAARNKRNDLSKAIKTALGNADAINISMAKSIISKNKGKHSSFIDTEIRDCSPNIRKFMFSQIEKYKLNEAYEAAQFLKYMNQAESEYDHILHQMDVNSFFCQD
jgi:hypothetical protein